MASNGSTGMFENGSTGQVWAISSVKNILCISIDSIKIDVIVVHPVKRRIIWGQVINSSRWDTFS